MESIEIDHTQSDIDST